MSVLILISVVFACGQGNIPMRKKSFTGALEFLPDGKLAEGYRRIRMSMPKQKDPLISPDNWYVEGNQQMKGMLGDAVLFFEWWTTLGSPAERYKFDWTSSGYFEVSYANDKGVNVFQRIDRYKLEKYPNLLKRFDNITPINIDFELTFHTGDIPDKDYYSFRKRYNIMEDLGSAGYAVNYTRTVRGDFILYKLSRDKTVWTSPAVFFGGWDAFLNMPEKYEDKKTRLIELFKIGETLVISSFRISKIKWRIRDFIYIAKKFEDYESGRDTPTAFDEVAEGEKKNKAGDESWDETDVVDFKTEAFYDQRIKTYGVRTLKGRVLVPPKYDQIVSGGKYYIAKNGNTAYLLDNIGRVIKTKTYPNIHSINSDLTVTVNSKTEDIEGTLYKVSYSESDSLMPGEEGIYKHYSTQMGLYLTVENQDDNRTAAEKKRDNVNREKATEQKIKETESKFESLGYKKGIVR
jgi:hypothetical protein